jgi:hypothetical protein
MCGPQTKNENLEGDRRPRFNKRWRPFLCKPSALQMEGAKVARHTTAPMQRTLHLAKRAGQILAQSAGRPDDELLDDDQLAQWFGVSRQWPCQARIHGYSPPFIRLGPKRIRHRRDQVNAWLLAQQQTNDTRDARPAWNRGHRKANGAASTREIASDAARAAEGPNVVAIAEQARRRDNQEAGLTAKYGFKRGN